MTDEPHTQPDQAPSEAPSLKTLASEKVGALDTGDSVKTAGDRLRENQADRWPVAEDRKLVGMLNEENPDWEIGGQGHDPTDWKVGQIMSRELVFCYEDEACTAARQLMEARGLRFLPVVDRQMRIVGIFSRAELEEKTRAQAAAKPFSQP